jgi:hypothetical protein
LYRTKCWQGEFSHNPKQHHHNVYAAIIIHEFRNMWELQLASLRNMTLWQQQHEYHVPVLRMKGHVSAWKPLIVSVFGLLQYWQHWRNILLMVPFSPQ